MALVLTTTALQNMIENCVNEGVVVDNPGIFSVTKIALFTGAPPITPATTWASLTEATFPGYAKAAITWVGPYQTGGGDAYETGGLISITPSGAVSGGQTITGYAIIIDNVDPLLIVVLGLEMFATPVIVTGVTTPVMFIPEIKLAVGSLYGAATQLAA